MEYLPLHFDLRGRPCLLVGGGQVALRKARLLIAAGAQIKVVAPAIEPAFKTLASDIPLTFDVREYQPSDLEDQSLVVVATNNGVLNAEISQAARAIHLPVNVVDQTELCTVIFPAIVDRDPVLMSVSTGGRSPVLTRTLREMLERLVPEGYSRLAEFLGQMRETLKKRIESSSDKRAFVERFLDSAEAREVMQGDTEKATQYFESSDVTATQGEVWLVGAGPGDPDLLTLKALQLMQRADLVLHDNLVSPGVLSRIRRDAEMRYVGKRSSDHALSQSALNQLLVDEARTGKKVLRLKGGDPFIFGRGGEELEELIKAGIPFQVVPGVTAASGCASYAGIPLTHRDYSQSVRFVTGHPKEGEVDLDWQEFVRANQTVVFYMGLGGLDNICRQLIAHGRDASTPVAIVSKGTLPDQQVITGTLSDLYEKTREADVQTPTLIIVGEVVHWYEQHKS